MQAISETPGAPETDWPPALETGAASDGLAELDIQRLAETFAVTPEAVRLAVARVGPGFREVQRELGGGR